MIARPDPLSFFLLAGFLIVSSSAVAAAEADQGPTVNFRSGRKEAEAPKPVSQAPVTKPAPAETTPEPGRVVAPPLAPAAKPAPAPEPPAAAEPGQAVTPEPAPPPPETIWLDDDLPPAAKAEGAWVWDEESFSSGARSHGHPSGKGQNAHGLEMEPAPIPMNGMITQQVWLDPSDPPRGISLQFRLATGEWVGVYWEAEEEVFRPSEELELWYYGALPEFGKWTKLEVLAEDLGVEDQAISGLRFVTFDGRALWDRTALTQAPPIEEPEEFPVPNPDFRPKLGGRQES